MREMIMKDRLSYISDRSKRSEWALLTVSGAVGNVRRIPWTGLMLSDAYSEHEWSGV